MLRAHMAQRIAERQRAEQLRAASLRAHVPKLAKLLFERGATRVILFGSLRPGGRSHMGSDIDLCVEGIAASERYDAASACMDAVGDADVDLVRWEDASAGLRDEIVHGVEVEYVYG